MRIGAWGGLLLLLGCATPDAPRAPDPLLALWGASTDPGGISIRWFVLEATFRGPGGRLVDTAAIDGVDVDRRRNPTDDWDRIAEGLPQAEREFIDRDLDPGGAFHYRITARFGGGASTSVETSVAAAAPEPWSLEFRNPAATVPPSVWVRIRKFEKGLGAVEASAVQRVGDRIGWWTEPDGPEPVSRHRATLTDGTSVEADFDIGATLIFIAPAMLPLEIKKCQTIYSKELGWVGCEFVTDRRDFNCFSIHYRDPKGAHLTHFPSPPDLDQRCDRHRLDPNAVARYPRILEAHRLLREAERLWDTDSAGAIRIYKRLLEEYRSEVKHLGRSILVERRARQAED